MSLLLNPCTKIKKVQNKFSIHHYFNACWLSFANNFLDQLQDFTITFSCIFGYPNSSINRISSIQITSDNRHFTLLCLCPKVFVEKFLFYLGNKVSGEELI